MGQLEPRVLASPSTPFVCVVEPHQIVVLAALVRIAEIGIAPDTDVALVGDYVAVLCATGHLYVVDPRAAGGPAVVTELELEPGARILASTGNHAVIAMRSGAAIIEITNQGQATVARLPPRLKLGMAAPSGLPDQFLLANGGVLEEWSGVSRSPVRRFRLERPITSGRIGGSSRHVWHADGDQLTVIKRDGSAPPTRISLPEPIASAVCDGSGALAIIGETSRRAWLVRIAERAITPLHDGPIAELAFDHGSVITLAPDGVLDHVAYGAPRAVEVAPEPVSEAASARDRLAAWTQRAQPTEWRDELVAWMKQPARASHLPACPPLREMAARLAIDDVGVIYACYGAWLCGHDGVAFSELVELASGRWAEVLGRGKLATSGAFVWHGARVHLAPEVIAALDEHAPRCGHVVASGAASASSARVVAPADVDLDTVAAWAAPSLGSLLVPDARGLREPSRFLLEARARGVTPLVPWQRAIWPRLDRAAIVVDDAAIAADLAPIRLVWPVAAAAA